MHIGLANFAMDYSKRWKLSASAVLFLGAVWIWISRIPENLSKNLAIAVPQIGFQAPDVNLRTPKGEQYSLSDLRGKAVILNIWASWCPPCRAEMPALQRVYEQYHSQGLEILAINATNQDNLDLALSFISEYQLTFPILLDNDGNTSKDYRVNSLPTTYFIDQAGIIRDVVIGGPMAEALLRVRVEKLIQE